jgi:hypothetical protein
LNAKDVTTMPYPGLTFRAIGGMLEFFVFLGPEPESVVKQYSDVIGKTFMPPYFALGFQLSRWGYRNTSNLKDAVDRTRDLEIPHVNMLTLQLKDTHLGFLSLTAWQICLLDSRMFNTRTLTTWMREKISPLTLSTLVICPHWWTK